MPPMTLKITYTKGTELKTLVLDAPSIKEALRSGYRQCQWDCILEITTPDNQTVQGKI
jgi:hypothetical protein